MAQTRYLSADVDFVEDDPRGEPYVSFHVEDDPDRVDVEVTRRGVYITGEVEDRDNWKTISILPMYISYEQLMDALRWLEEQDV